MEGKSRQEPRQMNWTYIKDLIPPLEYTFREAYILAYHTIHGVGVARFFILDAALIAEEWGDKLEYLCTCEFIKSKCDGNGEVAIVEDIDIFKQDIHFKNLGTVTHWMTLPKAPEFCHSFLDLKIDEVEMRPRLYNIFRSNGIFVMRDVLLRPAGKLLRIRNLGKKTLNELVKLYLDHGIDLKEIWKKDEDNLPNRRFLPHVTRITNNSLSF